MNDRDLITGLDACRPASDDLRQPELRAVSEHLASDRRAQEIRIRIERVDAAVSRTMQEVALPQGFAERLVVRLRAAAQEAAIGDTIGADVSPALVFPASSTSGTLHSRSQYSRRQWLAWSAGLTTAAAAVIAGVILLRPDKPLDSQALEASRQWHDAVAASEQWQSIGRDDLDQYPLPTELRYSPTRYHDASEVVGRDARAYDVTLPGGPRATLFVIPQVERAGVPSSAPTRLSNSTLGLGVASWQTGGFIYVVVLQSDRSEDYQSLLRTVAAHAA